MTSRKSKKAVYKTPVGEYQKLVEVLSQEQAQGDVRMTCWLSAWQFLVAPLVLAKEHRLQELAARTLLTRGLCFTSHDDDFLCPNCL